MRLRPDVIFYAAVALAVAFLVGAYLMAQEAEPVYPVPERLLELAIRGLGELPGNTPIPAAPGVDAGDVRAALRQVQRAGPIEEVSE